MQRYDIINHLIKQNQYKSYLEVGTHIKETFNIVQCPMKESIEPNKGDYTYNMTSDEAFKLIKAANKKYDIIFIDGLHLEHQVSKDIQNALESLNDGGLIVMHDCNPPTPIHASDPTWGGFWNGTCYKSFVKLRITNPNLRMCVVDTDWGCGIIDPSGKQELYPAPNIDIITNEDSIVNGPIKIDGMIITWKYFHEHRKELLNLLSVSEFLDQFRKKQHTINFLPSNPIPCVGDQDTSKFIFIGIPKSGCTYMKEEFIKKTPKVTYYSHSRCLSNEFIAKNSNLNYHWCHNLLKIPKFEDKIKFCIIRNPYDLLISYFLSRWTDGCGDIKIKLPREGIKTLLKKYCTDISWHLPLLQRFLYFQLFDENGNCKCDYAIIYDKFDEGLKQFCDKFGLNYNKGVRRNITITKTNYKNYYDEELITLVKNKCHNELTMFNFSFDGYGGTDALICIKNYKIDPVILKRSAN